MLGGMQPPYPRQIQQLPITPYLDDICARLKASPSRFLVLTAETAAGKSTAMPLALLRHFEGKIYMLEPRRIATLAVAARTAELLGESPGTTSGYIMHLERRVSPQTRFTVITEAVLTRMLQHDPALEGTSVVVIDEFHERSVHADLALAFLKEAMQLRDDLYVIVMSATIDTASVARYLGTDSAPAPVFSVSGKQFPVEVNYAGNISAAEAVLRELSDRRSQGSILVFLPGIAEIRRTAAELESRGADAEILTLHSSVGFSEQKKILEPVTAGAPRRVILSSAIAETSLTVPGVTVVIDSGKSRLSRMNIAAGMETLVTEAESLFSAEQRKGRAGRTAPGRCIRLWNEQEPRVTRTPPEILRSDILPLVLECAQWGVQERSKLDWLDAPPENAWESARQLLRAMGCLSPEITPLGKAALLMGLHPRLACVALAGSVEKACAYGSYADAAPAVQKKMRAETESRVQRCRAQFPELRHFSLPEPLFAGYPDRIARLAAPDGTYQFPSGRIATLPKDERQRTAVFPAWIVAPDADAGEREGRIYAWEAVDTQTTEQWLQERATLSTQLEFTEAAKGASPRLRKTEIQCYGKLVLVRRQRAVQAADFSEAACAAVRKEGLAWLPLSEKTQDFLLRAQFYAQHSGQQDEEKYTDSGLQQRVQEWLPPFVTGTSLSADEVYDALYFYLDGSSVDSHVPPKLTMPNGKSFRMRYERSSGHSIRPVMEIIIQQAFGCFKTPRVMGQAVLLKLLSPARRPLQVTDDLEGFWQNTWPEICKEMKGRYPKHNWDYRLAEKD